jgi:hypothetical protein
VAGYELLIGVLHLIRDQRDLARVVENTGDEVFGCGAQVMLVLRVEEGILWSLKKE